MTKQKIKLLRDLLDELLLDEKAQFAKDTGTDPDNYARIAKGYLGKELPRLGETRDAPQSDKRRTKHARDAAEDAAARFEQNCRELRLRLQRGEK